LELDLNNLPVDVEERPTLYLVSCVSVKLAHPAPAEELYASSWFKKARAYVAASCGAWRILSAKHGILKPTDVIGPYDLTLNSIDVAARRAWAKVVLESLDLGHGDRVELLAGQRYREFIIPGLRARHVQVNVPMAGLGFGAQLRWLARHTKRPTPRSAPAS
jgi:hypothetical protein